LDTEARHNVADWNSLAREASTGWFCMRPERWWVYRVRMAAVLA
jgi:hypothetical protein